MWKRNENNEITRYKARLAAQDFSQRLGIDYEEAYSPMVDAITLIVTIYLYGSLDKNISMKVPKGFKVSKIYKSSSLELCSIKLHRSLCELKQSIWM